MTLCTPTVTVTFTAAVSTMRQVRTCLAHAWGCELSANQRPDDQPVDGLVLRELLTGYLDSLLG